MRQRFNGEQEEGLTQDFDPRFRSPYHDPSDCYLRYRIDPTAAPKTIDLDDYSEKRQLTALGIYEITGDQLKICLTRYLRAVEAPPAPQEFRNQSQFGEYSLPSWIDTDFQKTKKRCRAGGRLPRKLKRASLSLKKNSVEKPFLFDGQFVNNGNDPKRLDAGRSLSWIRRKSQRVFRFLDSSTTTKEDSNATRKECSRRGALWHLQVRRRPADHSLSPRRPAAGEIRIDAWLGRHAAGARKTQARAATGGAQAPGKQNSETLAQAPPPNALNIPPPTPRPN